MVGWGGGSGHRELRIDGPRAEEDHALGRPVQGAQGFADGVVPDVAAGVEVEAVLACAPGGCSVGPTVGSAGPRLDAGEVDPAHGELVHRGHQAARGVGEVEDHRGSVGAGRLAGCAGLADEEEAGDGVVGVDHSLGQRDQPVQGGGRRRGDGGVGAALGDVLGGTGVRCRDDDLRVRVQLLDVASNLARRDRVGGDGPHLIGGEILRGGDGEGDVEGHLGVGLDRAAVGARRPVSATASRKGSYHRDSSNSPPSV